MEKWKDTSEDEPPAAQVQGQDLGLEQQNAHKNQHGHIDL